MAMEEEAVEEEGVMGMAKDMVGVIIYFAIPEVCWHFWSEGTLVKRLPTELTEVRAVAGLLSNWDRQRHLWHGLLFLNAVVAHTSLLELELRLLGKDTLFLFDMKWEPERPNTCFTLLLVSQ